MNAPGGKMNSNIPSPLNNFKPKIEPAPNISLKEPSKVKANVNPNPMPMPSNNESDTLCLEAKASARPKIIQLTTINGMNIPSDESNAGKYALITNCKIETKAAITTINTGIRTLSGTRFLIADIAILEHIKTNIVQSPIAIPFDADVVVASVGHIPSNKAKVGFSFIIPFIIIFNPFIVKPPICFGIV